MRELHNPKAAEMAKLNVNQLFLTLAVIVLVLIAALFGYRLEVWYANGLRFEPPPIATPSRLETKQTRP